MSKTDVGEVVERLRRGVQYERYGDMEPDIFDANESMRVAADLLQSLSERVEALEAKSDVSDFLLAEARNIALEEAVKAAQTRSRDWLGQHRVAANEIASAIHSLKTEEE